MRQTQDLHVQSLEPLISPRMIKREQPITDKASETVAAGREAIGRILSGQDPRLIVVVGPCSIHDEEAAIDYARRLNELRERCADRLLIVMRVYFEKPRTTLGWRGLIIDPRLDGSCDITAGLRKARSLLMRITGLGLAAGNEVLDPIVPQYIADLISWSAIGARTTESQTHREIASGLSMPIGFKNSTDGNMQIAVDAMQSARNPHSFVGIDQEGRTCIVNTSGNPAVHMILRGGRSGPNHDPATIEAAGELMARQGLVSALMIDCSHANSEKKPERQAVVWNSVLELRRRGCKSVMGLMLESNLHAGSQPIPKDLKNLRYGVSVTDPCIDWESTRDLILEAYESEGAKG